MTLLRYLLLTVVLCTSGMSLASGLDSLRLEEREDGSFVIHRVSSGETLFSISKRYGADLAQVAALNKLDGYAINIGQILEIPMVKVEKQEIAGATYHTVKKGETLYAISHVYGVNIYDLKSWNELTSNNISEGQRLVVSGASSTQSAVVEISEPKNQKSGTGGHVVKQGETLFSISKAYGLTVDELRELNSLSDNSLSVGQNLRVKKDNQVVVANNTGQQSETETATTNEDPVKEPIADATVEVETTDISETDSASNIPERRPRFANTTDKTETTSFQKVYEEGFAMQIENSPKTKKYLCLHRTLPIGAIIQVRNLMNNQSIFVRVVGTLPDTGNNEKVLIRLSNIAYTRLGALDAKFPVEVSYIPE